MHPLLRQIQSLLARFTGPDTLPDPEAWAVLVRAMPLLASYSAQELEDLRHLVGRFIRQKDFYGGEDLKIVDHMRLLIAVQACVPILKLGLGWYRGWSSIVVYASEFRTPRTDTDAAGVVHQFHSSLIGEAWADGPVVLSWPHVREGAVGTGEGNVVIHEFAHKLDMLNGHANGMPPLHRGMDRVKWTEILTAAFNDLNWHLRHIGTTTLDAYAARDPAEFFARISEAFFVEPDKLRETWPAVYEQLRLFYRQDPLSALPFTELQNPENTPL